MQKLAGSTGLEPSPSCVTGTRSNQLNYALALPLIIPFRSSNGLPLPAIPSGREKTYNLLDFNGY